MLNVLSYPRMCSVVVQVEALHAVITSWFPLTFGRDAQTRGLATTAMRGLTTPHRAIANIYRQVPLSALAPQQQQLIWEHTAPLLQLETPSHNVMEVVGGATLDLLRLVASYE